MPGGLAAGLVQGWLGLRVLPRSWFNFDVVWASSLVAVGGLSLTIVWWSP